MFASNDLWEIIYHYETLQGKEPVGGVELFGRLEELDIGHIGSSRSNYQGCIATIAWLNGGRLRKINMNGISIVSIYDINVLHGICGPRLHVFEPDVSVARPSEAPNIIWGTNLRELDLAHCSGLIKDGSVSFLSFLRQLRSLRLDCVEFNEDGLLDFVSNTQNLLRLSIQQCSTVTCSKLSRALLQNRQLKLIELDARDINMDCSLAHLRQSCEGILRLNNRYTTIGTRGIHNHASVEKWRVGARALASVGQKRVRNDESKNNNMNSSGPFMHACTILSTGFSQKPDTQQQFYTCATCGINFGRVICFTCAKKCHAGHDIVYAGYTPGYCDCCILSECLCL